MSLFLVCCFGCGGKSDASGLVMDASSNPSRDAGLVASKPADAGAHLVVDASISPTIRGRYLVESVAACGRCHTPRTADGRFDQTKLLSGVECLEDVLPDDPQRGCVHSRNLTNDETGLKNRSDDDIIDMFTKGERPDGKNIHPYMPYWVFGNMTKDDARAIVSYLRTVPAVEHMVPPNEPPFTMPDEATPRWPEESIPQPRADYSERDAALRGRYLAGSIGGCMECHTPRDDHDDAREDQAFWGGKQVMDHSGTSVSSNLTPDTSGLAAYSVDDIVRAIVQGADRARMWQSLCEPMSIAGMSLYAGMTREDASDIAHYLKSIAPAAHAIERTCLPAASGGEDAGM